MLVTQIAEVSKSRCKVYIDQEFAFVLYKGELRLYHVRENEEIEEADYQKIITEVLPKRAKLRAMNLLQKKDYTVAQLREKLVQGDYPEAIIEIALDYVAAYHYTDDLRYARDYITYHAEFSSRKKIEFDLYRKGISKENVQKAFLEWEDLGGVDKEEEMIRKLLEKRHFDRDAADAKELSKTYAFLARKGFAAEKIRRVVNSENIDSYT